MCWVVWLFPSVLCSGCFVLIAWLLQRRKQIVMARPTIYIFSFLNPHHGRYSVHFSFVPSHSLGHRTSRHPQSPPKYVSLRIPPNLHPIQPSRCSHRLLSSVSLTQLVLILPTLYLNQCIPPLSPS